jgi:hypothetical protein
MNAEKITEKCRRCGKEAKLSEGLCDDCYRDDWEMRSPEETKIGAVIFPGMITTSAPERPGVGSVEMAEGSNRILTTCPNCGNEVREDFSFCPFCETPLKPFCPSCKRELEPGYVRCPYCGFRLGSETPAKTLYAKGGRVQVP